MELHPKEKATLELLDKLGIAYKHYDHDIALTMEACEGIGSDVGAQHFKNLFLCNRQGTSFYLVLLSPHKQFRTADISKKLGVSRLSFATPEQLMEKLGVLPGSVTPMALASPGARDVVVVIDRDVERMETVCAHPCVSSASVAMSKADLFRFLGWCGNELRFVDVEVAQGD